MIDHRDALTLAATAVDFPLGAADHGMLEAHVRECPACRTELAGFHGDAARLAALPPIAPPAWVRGAIGKTHRSNPFVMLAAAALLLTAAAGLALVVGSRLREDRTAVVVPTSLPDVITTPVVIDPSTAHWTAIGEAPGGQLVGFGGGYVALGSRGDSEEPIAWFSKDGRSWAVTSLANSVANCPGWGPPGNEMVPDADATAIATNGRQIIVVGAESPHDSAGCADVGASIRPIAWLSDDGRTWRRSAPFYTGGPNGRATAVWAVPDGWQAVAEDPKLGTLSVWQSADGHDWRSVGPLAANAAEVSDVAAAAASNGSVVLSRAAGPVGGGNLRLFTSPDGRTWTLLDKAGGCETSATQIVAPRAPGLGTWVLSSDARICTSRNLINWSTAELPMALVLITQTRYGAIALGDTCYGAGSNCPDPGPKAYLTVDGVTWSPIEHPKVYYGRSLADGPAGVLLIGTGPDAGGALVTSAWLLEP